jgi:DNA-binding NarL/FixJ family response regulator
MEVSALPPQQLRAPLPLAAENAPADKTTAEIPRILIVEDEYFVAIELEAELADAGFAVIGTARTAHEAIRLARAERPTLIIMDVRLPGPWDGIDAAINIYRSTGIRCIFTTAYGEPDVRERAQAADPLGWLPKPYQLDALIRLIRDAV